MQEVLTVWMRKELLVSFQVGESFEIREIEIHYLEECPKNVSFQVGESFENGEIEIMCLEKCPKTNIPSIASLNFRFGEIGLVFKECDIHGIVHLPNER